MNANALATPLRAHWELAVALALLLVFFVGEHFHDTARDAELVKLHHQIAADSAVRMHAVAKTDTAGRTQDSAVAASARVDTVWRSAAAHAGAKVDTILASSTPDTVKIQQLVQVDSSLIAAGNALADTTRQLREAAVQFRVAAASERASWETERNHLSHALDVSESQHRHWGLGCTAGGGVVRVSTGQIVGAPGVMCGLTYRW